MLETQLLTLLWTMQAVPLTPLVQRCPKPPNYLQCPHTELLPTSHSDSIILPSPQNPLPPLHRVMRVFSKTHLLTRNLFNTATQILVPTRPTAKTRASRMHLVKKDPSAAASYVLRARNTGLAAIRSQLALVARLVASSASAIQTTKRVEILPSFVRRIFSGDFQRNWTCSYLMRVKWTGIWNFYKAQFALDLSLTPNPGWQFSNLLA